MAFEAALQGETANPVRTNPDWVLAAVRIILGVVFFPHGAQKMLGWLGGRGLTNTMAHFTTGAKLPGVVAFLVVATEFCASLGLMMGTLAKTHIPHGFFMNWVGNSRGRVWVLPISDGNGFTNHLKGIGCAVVGLHLVCAPSWRRRFCFPTSFSADTFSDVA